MTCSNAPATISVSTLGLDAVRWTARDLCQPHTAHRQRWAEVQGTRLPRITDQLPGGYIEASDTPQSWYRVNVKTSTQPVQKRRPTTAGTLVGTRFQIDLLAAIDEWRKAQPDLPTRPEAVRRLVEIGMNETSAGTARHRGAQCGDVKS